MRRNSPVLGFTIIELLVVISIISVLVAMLLPTMTLAREYVRTATCAANLRQTCVTLSTYAQDYKDFPANWSSDYVGFVEAGANQEDTRRQGCSGMAMDCSTTPAGWSGTSWSNKILSGYYGDPTVVYETSPLRTSIDFGMTQNDAVVNGVRRAVYMYHGPGTSSYCAWIFGWSWGYSANNYYYTIPTFGASFATLRPYSLATIDVDNLPPAVPWGTCQGSDQSNQVLVTCPRMYTQYSFTPTGMPGQDPHMNYNPAATFIWSQQNFYTPFYQKAIERAYVDGHVKFYGSVDVAD